MAKVMLVISPCMDNKGSITVDTSTKFEVMLNPSSYTHSHSISHNQSKVQGQTAPESKFSAIGSETVSFDLLIDGTGVVPPSTPGSAAGDVKTQIGNLKGVIYKYDGNEHEPRIVRLLWGSLSFIGRLQSMSVQYTLFKPGGEPLRAKISLSFINYMSNAEESLRADRRSPDLTHVVEVRAGDTLPLLCYRIYKDCSYYTEIARINNITSFRDLQPGVKLSFPPLR